MPSASADTEMLFSRAPAGVGHVEIVAFQKGTRGSSAPQAPTAAEYDFGRRSLSNARPWSLTPPEIAEDEVAWAIIATASNDGTGHDVLSRSDWSTARPWAAGTELDSIFMQAADKPDSPDNDSTRIPSGWSGSPPARSAGDNPVWEVAQHRTGDSSTWIRGPARQLGLDGEDGEDGSDGDPGADGQPGLPGVGVGFSYDDRTSRESSIISSSEGRYYLGTSSRAATTWAAAKTATRLAVSSEDAAGIDHEDYYDSLEVGDLATWFIDDDQWLDYRITAITDVNEGEHRFGIRHLEGRDGDGTMPRASADAQLLFSRAPAGEPGEPGEPGEEGISVSNNGYLYTWDYDPNDQSWDPSASSHTVRVAFKRGATTLRHVDVTFSRPGTNLPGPVGVRVATPSNADVTATPGSAKNQGWCDIAYKGIEARVAAHIIVEPLTVVTADPPSMVIFNSQTATAYSENVPIRWSRGSGTALADYRAVTFRVAQSRHSATPTCTVVSGQRGSLGDTVGNSDIVRETRSSSQTHRWTVTVAGAKATIVLVEVNLRN